MSTELELCAYGEAWPELHGRTAPVSVSEVWIPMSAPEQRDLELRAGIKNLQRDLKAAELTGRTEDAGSIRATMAGLQSQLLTTPEGK